MIQKVQEKEKVIELRRKGYTYREILNEVPVSKSSVSTWLKSSPLTEIEKKILSERKDADISRWRLRAVASRRANKESENLELLGQAKKEFAEFSSDSFFHLGIALYWAEGTKRNSFFAFTNSDPDMLNMMIRWTVQFLGISREEIKLRLYTHKAFASENQEKFWSEQTNIPLSQFGKTAYKSVGLQVKKRPNYKGCIRLELGKVRYLRKMAFWQNMLIEYYKK